MSYTLDTKSKRIAIVGGGISGLSALWLLNEHSPHDVEIFESADYFGGHANTILFEQPGKRPCWVDTAFLMFNRSGWPNFVKFLSYIGVPYQESTGSYSCSRGSFGWSSKGISALFASTWGLLDTRPWQILYDIIRFNNIALEVLGYDTTKSEGREETVEEYLHRQGFSEAFKEVYLIPLASTVWSTPPHTLAQTLPIRILVEGFHSLKMLSLFNRPPWLAVRGGSREYVKRVVSRVSPDKVHLNCPVESVSEGVDKVKLTCKDGVTREFDHVILATHSNISHQLLQNGGLCREEDKNLLSRCEWTNFEVIMHWDERLMPANKKTWSAWNNIIPSEKDKQFTRRSGQVSTTFDLNLLHDLPVSEHGRVFGSINPTIQPDPKKVVSVIPYSQPVLSFSRDSTEVEKMKSNDRNRRVSFAGAWFKLGTHEDGWLSGVDAAERLGAKLPWKKLARGESEVTSSTSSGFSSGVFGIAYRTLIGDLSWLGHIWRVKELAWKGKRGDYQLLFA